MIEKDWRFEKRIEVKDQNVRKAPFQLPEKLAFCRLLVVLLIATNFWELHDRKFY